MNQLIDNLVALRVLHILLQPIEKSDAFQLGIIDKNGKQIKTPKSEAERDAFTILNKLAFKIKNLIKKNIQGERDLQSLAKSIHVVKECLNQDIYPENLEEIYQNTTITKEDILNTKNLILTEDLRSFSSFMEDAPANNAAATPGIDGLSPETIGVKKSKVLRRRKLKKFKSF